MPGNFIAIFIRYPKEFHCTFIESFITGFRVNGALPNMETYTNLARKLEEEKEKEMVLTAVDTFRETFKYGKISLSDGKKKWSKNMKQIEKVSRMSGTAGSRSISGTSAYTYTIKSYLVWPKSGENKTADFMCQGLSDGLSGGWSQSKSCSCAL